MCFFLSPAVIESLFLELSPEEILRDLKMDNLRKLWDRVAMQSPIREKIIQDLKHTLQTVEEERGQKVIIICSPYLFGIVLWFSACCSLC